MVLEYKEKRVWEVIALYVGEEEVGANTLSNYMTSIMDITNPGLFFGFWTVDMEKIRNAKF